LPLIKINQKIEKISFDEHSCFDLSQPYPFFESNYWIQRRETKKVELCKIKIFFKRWRLFEAPPRLAPFDRNQNIKKSKKIASQLILWRFTGLTLTAILNRKKRNFYFYYFTWNVSKFSKIEKKNHNFRPQFFVEIVALEAKITDIKISSSSYLCLNICPLKFFHWFLNRNFTKKSCRKGWKLSPWLQPQNHFNS